DIDATGLQPGPRLLDLPGCELVAVVAGLDLPGIGRDPGADMARHDDRALDVRRVQPEVGLQGFGEALHRELGGAVGGLRDVDADLRPETVDAAGIDDVTLVRLLQHRQEGAGAEIDAAPADVEGPLPLV